MAKEMSKLLESQPVYSKFVYSIGEDKVAITTLHYVRGPLESAAPILSVRT